MWEKTFQSIKKFIKVVVGKLTFMLLPTPIDISHGPVVKTNGDFSNNFTMIIIQKVGETDCFTFETIFI